MTLLLTCGIINAYEVLMTRGPNSHTFRTREGSLMWRLADYSDLVKRSRNNTITVIDKIPLNYDTYGILDKRDMFKQLLGSVATEYHWQGSYAGPHHLMWPRRAYQLPTAPGLTPDISSPFRESPTLKVILPRELHDYLHFVTEPPKMPSKEVMRQYTLEQTQITRLYNLVNRASLRTAPYDEDVKEALRTQRLHDGLSIMQDSQVGLMPDKQLLASLPLNESRRMLRHLAHPLGISAAKACQQVFFADPHTP